MLLNHNRKEVLPLAEDLESKAAARRTHHPRPGMKRETRSAWLREGIKAVGPNQYTISRRTLNRILSNTTEMTRARIIPAIVAGKSAGFRVYSIRPGSLFDVLGLKNGDQLHGINGHPIHTPEHALQAYTMLRNADHFSVAITRRGAKLTSDYKVVR